MFDHYIHHQKIDPRRRWRIVLAANIASGATASLLAFAWVADKLQIARVDAPTSDYVMFQMMGLESTPLPPPPPPPLGDDKPEPVPDDTPPEDEPVPVEDIVQPDERLKPKPKRLADNGRRGSPLGAEHGVPLGTGSPSNPFGNLRLNTGVLVPRDPIPQPPTTRDRTVPEPIAAMRARCRFCPDPDQSKIAGTKAGMFDRRSGENRTAFCVNPDGHTSRVRTTKSFPGDPAVDTICRDTVKRWILDPLRIAGKPVTSCSAVTFKFTFQR